MDIRRSFGRCIFFQVCNYFARNISHMLTQLGKRLCPLLCAHLINCKIVLNCVVFVRKDSQPRSASLESSVPVEIWSPNSLNRGNMSIDQGRIVPTFIANKKPQAAILKEHNRI